MGKPSKPPFSRVESNACCAFFWTGQSPFEVDRTNTLLVLNFATGAASWRGKLMVNCFFLLVRWVGNEKWSDPDLNHSLLAVSFRDLLGSFPRFYGLIPHSFQPSFFPKTGSVFPGFPEVFLQEGSLERMGKVPLDLSLSNWFGGTPK